MLHTFAGLSSKTLPQDLINPEEHNELCICLKYRSQAIIMAMGNNIIAGFPVVSCTCKIFGQFSHDIFTGLFVFVIMQKARIMP
jgi:hypothetical protein